MRSPEDIRIDGALRNAVLPLIEQAPEGELRARLLKELRRGYDSNTSHRHRVLAAARVMREWAKTHLSVDDFGGSVVAEEAFERFVLDTKHDRKIAGRRCFYQALRQAGFTVEAIPGRQALVLNTAYTHFI